MTATMAKRILIPTISTMLIYSAIQKSMPLADALPKSEKNPSEQVEKHLNDVNRSDLDGLNSAFSYKGTENNTLGILQGEARFIKPDGEIMGMYTFGADPCLILMAVARDAKNGEVVNVGMAHVDARVKEKDIPRFFSRLVEGQQSPPAVDIYIISGEKELALKTLAAAEKFGNVKFMNADLEGWRDDAVAISKCGEIYYGDRWDLDRSETMFPPAKVHMVEAEREAVGGLFIDNDPGKDDDLIPQAIGRRQSKSP